MQSIETVPSWEDIRESHDAIQSMIHRTPTLTSSSLNAMSGADLFFKCENFQKIGAFKMRGAINAALRLAPEAQQKGLATHSSGNHAQAVALSAKTLGVPAYIVMPEDAPKIKIAATKGYGANITFCQPTITSRTETLEKVVEKVGATFIHPFNDYNVIAGQATAAKELFEDTDELDIIMTPIGGGGLFCGTALTSRYLSPKTKIIGTEPLEVDDAFRSFKSGAIATNETIDTIADGLRTNLGEKTFDILYRFADDVLTVTEEAIVSAMKLVWERMKIIIEPSSAVPIAAVFSNPDRFYGKKIGIVITGGNVDLTKLPFLN